MSRAAPPESLRDLVADSVRDVPDYPKPGVVFKDITPLLAEPRTFRRVVDALAAPWEGQVDKVVGIEARGFIVAAPVALDLGAGFVPVRKPGKLPGPTYTASYTLEYGEETLEMHRDALRPGERVLVVDDVLATGGTAAAACGLVRRAGAHPVGVSVLLELDFLRGRERLGDLVPEVLLTV